MAKKDRNQKQQRVFCALGPYMVTWDPAPETVMEKIGDREYQRRAPAGMSGRKLTFREGVGDAVVRFAIVKNGKVGKWPYFLHVIEPNDPNYEMKVNAITESRAYKEGMIWDNDVLRERMWEQENKENYADRMAYVALLAKLYGKPEEVVKREADEEYKLTSELRNELTEQINKRSIKNTEPEPAAATTG